MTDAYRKVSIRQFCDALTVPTTPFSPRHKAVQRGILSLLSSRPRLVVSMAELTDWLWGDDPNGGPDSPNLNIRTAILRLRQKHIPIKTHGWAGYSFEPRA